MARVPVSTDGEKYETIELTRTEFRELREYSCSMPTGPKHGFRWKCNLNAFGPNSLVSDTEEKMTGILNDWWMGEAYVIYTPESDVIGIKWRRIRLVDDLE